EIEWALDEAGFTLRQARPLHVEPAAVPDAIWLQHPGLRGHPAGIGWGTRRAGVIKCECQLARLAPGGILVTAGGRPPPAGIGWGPGRAVVINCECELARVAPGDILVTRVAGPALSHVLPH